MADSCGVAGSELPDCKTISESPWVLRTAISVSPGVLPPEGTTVAVEGPPCFSPEFGIAIPE
eukprot:CAMPEP_0184322494 /NCGR_PEP_ID=MMETSP1049-20130417/124753_1 /TAXON_ID=77928 /ORGANISM="Proteomonas sulcata, Strain CCMP704" /LENGTH=61 /DNA_ID=CAMNT_0026643651 /DNA_START=248 /DNA_END=433 /DNA_ORIENTATION=+